MADAPAVAAPGTAPAVAVAPPAPPAGDAPAAPPVPAVTDAAKAGTDAPAGEGTKATAPDPPAAEYTFTAPDGVTLDAKLVAEFTPLAKEMGLKPDQAQKLVDLYAKAQQDAGKAYEAQVVAMEAGWRDEIKADPVYGGAKFEATERIAKVAVERFETEVPGLKDFFEQTGTGSHPVMVKLFAALGAKISEDRPPLAPSVQNAEVTLAEKMYPNSK